MSPKIRIHEDKKVIHRIVTGELYTARSIKLVRELAVAVKLNRGYGILMDLHDTVTRPETLDLLEIATECYRNKYDFKGGIAFIIPDTEERHRAAKIFKHLMEAKGFKFRQFSDFDAAMHWLVDWSIQAL